VTVVNGPDPEPSPAGERAQIFAAVLRRYLTTPEESSFGGGFANVYVLDRTDGRAGEPLGTPSGVGTSIPAADQETIAQALADLTDVTFVASEDDVVETIDGCAQVREGILMTLGDPVGSQQRVEVAVSGFVACLGATWLTYVVEHDGSDWRVTGTTGPIAVA
jgi:hypothetical protein